MKRLFATASRYSFCIVLPFAAVLSAADQSTVGQAPAMAAMLSTHTASAATATRRFIEPAEARVLWDDPQIKAIRAEAENTWDFTAPDGVPGFGPLLPEDARKLFERW
jgi:hypothetical protein